MAIKIEEIKQAIVRSNTEIDFSNLEPKTKFSEVGVDSLDVFNIILEVQNISGLEIPDTDIEELDSIENIYNYLQTHIKK